MKLYYDPISTTSRPVMLFLAEHEMAVEPVVVSLIAKDHLTEDYRAINPNQAVPTLVDGDLYLFESSAILKYLAEVAQSPTYPADLKSRAMVNAMMDWFNTGYSHDVNHAVVYPAVFPTHAFENPMVQAEIARRGMEAAKRRLDVLDRHVLADQPFVCGGQVSLADYLGATQVSLGEAIEFDLSPWPNVGGWMRRMKDRPSWGSAFAAFNGLLAYAREQRRQSA
jgi:glutathione S-transferase